jgi:hypothetical protein
LKLILYNFINLYFFFHVFLERNLSLMLLCVLGRMMIMIMISSLLKLTVLRVWNKKTVSCPVFFAVNALARYIDSKIWTLMLNRCTLVLKWRTILETYAFLMLILFVDGIRCDLCVVMPLLQTLCGLVVTVISQCIICVLKYYFKLCTLRNVIFVLWCIWYVFVIAIS